MKGNVFFFCLSASDLQVYIYNIVFGKKTTKLVLFGKHVNSFRKISKHLMPKSRIDQIYLSIFFKTILDRCYLFFSLIRFQRQRLIFKSLFCCMFFYKLVCLLNNSLQRCSLYPHLLSKLSVAR